MISVLWVAVLIIFSIHLNRHRLSGAPSAPPPVYSSGLAVPLEKVEAQPQALSYTAPTQQPNGQANGQPQFNQPQPNQSNQPQFTQQPAPPQFTTPYTQAPSPVNRDIGGISPLSTTSDAYNAAELASPQHTGGYNVSELSSTEHNSIQHGSTQQSTMQRSTMSYSSTQHTGAAELSGGQQYR